jgi:predicted ABC-type ATPase
MPNLYIIAGCNGAGKTTASLTILPEILDCREFVNADLIAYGLSPLNVKSVAMEAGRLMLRRIKELLQDEKDFAFETTLATRSYVNLIREAKTKGYEVTLLYFWLHSPEQAKERVAERVAKGGHNIEDEVVERRYYRGISNFFKLYSPVCDNWALFDNTVGEPGLVAEGGLNFKTSITSSQLWDTIQKQIL